MKMPPLAIPGAYVSALLVSVLALLSASFSHASTLTWDASGAATTTPTDGAGTWDTTFTGWNDGASSIAWPNTTADIAVFGAANGAAGAITVGTVTANGITFNAAGSGTYTLSGGTITLDGTTPTITTNADASISSVLAGTAGITKAGAGTLTLSTATNTFAGGLTISSGVLSYSNNLSLGGTGGTAGTVTINGGTLRNTLVGTVTNTHAITIGASGGTIQVSATQTTFGTAGTLLGSGTLTFAGDGTLNSNNGSGFLDGSQNVIFIGVANTGFTGNVIIGSGALVEYQNSSALGTTGSVTLNSLGELALGEGDTLSNALTINGGVLSFTRFSSGNGGTAAGTVTLGAGGATLGLRNFYNTSGTNGWITGNITGSGSLTVGTTTGIAGGTVALGGTNDYTGATILNSGTLQIGNGGTTGSILNTSGFTFNGGTLAVNRSDNVALTDIAAITSITGTGGFVQSGSGTTTLGGTHTYTGTTTVANGTLALTGSINSGTTSGVVVGNTAATKARLNVSGNITANNLLVGTNATATGAVYQTGGTVSFGQGAGTNNLALGASASGYGYYALSGGTVTANEIGVGGLFNASTGVMDVTGGTATSNGYLAVGRGGTTSSGVLNVTGGTVEFGKTLGTGPLDLNWATTSGAISIVNIGGGSGAANVTGASSSTATGTFAGKGLNLAASNTAGTTGIVNLLANGTLTVSDVVSANGTSNAYLNFNGGTLKATSTNRGTTFMAGTNIDGVYVYENGGTIHNNGTAITVGAALIAPSGSGVSSIAVSGGTGYIGAPMVKITGGTGTGATGYATIDGSGNLTGIVITNHGTGYAPADVLTATLTGGGGTGASIGTITLAANSGGGMTFSGGGTTTLTGTNTYSGLTTVSAGTLALSGTGSVNASSGVSVATGATFSHGGSVAVTTALTLAEGSSLAGAGSFTPGSTTVTANLADGFAAIAAVSGLVKSGTLTFNLTNIAAGDYTLFSSATPSGDFTSVSVTSTSLSTADSGATFTGADGSWNYVFTNASNLLSITAIAIPEPSTSAALAGLGIFSLAIWRRRQS